MKRSKLIWKDATMKEALEFSQGKTIKNTLDKDIENPDKERYAADVVQFTDGSAVACLSRWVGPWSEVTPDVDAESPRWWIGGHYD